MLYVSVLLNKLPVNDTVSMSVDLIAGKLHCCVQVLLDGLAGAVTPARQAGWAGLVDMETLELQEFEANPLFSLEVRRLIPWHSVIVKILRVTFHILGNLSPALCPWIDASVKVAVLFKLTVTVTEMAK